MMCSGGGILLSTPRVVAGSGLERCRLLAEPSLLACGQLIEKLSPDHRVIPIDPSDLLWLEQLGFDQSLVDRAERQRLEV